MAEEKKVEQEKIEPVVSHPVKVRKKSGARKFLDNVIQEDVQNVKSYIFDEVVLPALKNTISDVVSNGIDMFLYGESRGRRSSGRSTSGLSRISYRDYGSYSRDRRDRDDEPRRRAVGYDFDEIIFDNKGDAEMVLCRMDEVIEKCGVVTVADFYEFAGEPGKWTDNKYGWTNLDDVSPVRTRDGYYIPFPKVRMID